MICNWVLQTKIKFPIHPLEEHDTLISTPDINKDLAANPCTLERFKGKADFKQCKGLLGKDH